MTSGTWLSSFLEGGAITDEIEEFFWDTGFVKIL
jgi:hypothetical protein